MRFWLFLSSYTPLFLILGLRSFPDERQGFTWALLAPAVMLIASIAGLISLTYLLGGLSSKVPKPVTVQNVVDEGGNLSAYLISYLFPFVYSSINSWRDIVVFIIFGGLIVIIGVRSDMGLFNPLLVMLGWRVVKVSVCEVWGGREVWRVRYAIVKGALYDGSVKAKKLSSGYVIEGNVN